MTIWLVKNLILIQAIAFKKALLFGGLVGLKRGEWFQNTPYFLKGMRF
ncbi:hypothetical protein HPHPP25_0248 [Helicobacter pylori Hp P-25]|nr:hypothetical protein HPHPP25_0248 [Helicobacter pylori Hp P-25]EJC35606.1 hypothetical protein HPHPP25C_0099 [Helicobacter pylori Hp P-25c]